MTRGKRSSERERKEAGRRRGKGEEGNEKGGELNRGRERKDGEEGREGGRESRSCCRLGCFLGVEAAGALVSCQPY